MKDPKEEFNKGLSKAARDAFAESQAKAKKGNPFYKRPKKKKPKAPISAPKVQPRVVAPKPISGPQSGKLPNAPKRARKPGY